MSTYRGLALMQAYDHQPDCPGQSIGFVVHQAIGHTVAVLTVEADRALVIATKIADMFEWSTAEPRCWQGDMSFRALLADYPGEAELPIYNGDDLEPLVPYGEAVQ